MAHLFSFLKGDSLWHVMLDAARYAREHDMRALIEYGGRTYEVHPDNTSEEALRWLMGEMQNAIRSNAPEASRDTFSPSATGRKPEALG